MILPIQAYPVMTNESHIFPKLIDFGNVRVGDTSTMVFPISNKVPINFEYGFEAIPNKNYLEGEVVISPMYGLVPKKGQVEIEVSFSPSTNSTVV
jgi:hypothetical protein